MTPSSRRWQRGCGPEKSNLASALRVTVAAMGALVIALALGLKLPLWAVLTSIIVTQMSVGRSLKATRDYLIGTWAARFMAGRSLS